jgi:phage gp29-like protein
MTRLERIAHYVRDGWTALTRPAGGRVYRYEPTMDSMRAVLTRGITFERLDTLLRDGDDGDITDAMILFDEIERSDARVFSLAGTRRRALIGLGWEIVSAADKQSEHVDKALADDAAAYARERIDSIDTFDTALSHLATAIGPNLAVLELIWEPGELIDLAPIPSWRLTMRPEKSPAIRVLTADERTYGVEAVGLKWCVHLPNGMSGSPIDRSLHRAQAMIWLWKKLALCDWGAFCELFGMPVRVGRYDPGVSDAEKTNLRAMLEGMGSRGWAMISRAVEIVFAESSQRGIAPFEAFLGWLTRESAVLWLGGNLTSDTSGGTGTYAAASVQDEVRDDLRDADIQAEARTVREQILAPMVRCKFPGRDVPVPYFERTVPEDSLQVAARVAAWQRVGLRVPADWARSQSGIPEPEPDEKVLEPPDAFEEGLREGGGFEVRG